MPKPAETKLDLKSDDVPKVSRVSPSMHDFLGFFFFLGFCVSSGFFMNDQIALVLPCNFWPTLSLYSHYQLLIISTDLKRMESEFQVSQCETYLEWYFKNKDRASFDSTLKTFILYQFSNFDSGNEAIALFLIFSPNLIKIDDQLYIPWHFLYVLLVKKGLLREEMGMFIGLYPKMSKHSAIGDGLKNLTISNRSPFRMLLNAFLNLRTTILPMQEQAEAYLILEETLKLFSKYGELTKQHRETLLWGTFLERLKQFPIKASWGLLFPSTARLMRKNLFTVEILSSEMYQKFDGVKSSSLATGVIFINIAIALILVWFAYFY